jgi:hypothetical protein
MRVSLQHLFEYYEARFCSRARLVKRCTAIVVGELYTCAVIHEDLQQFLVACLADTVDQRFSILVARIGRDPTGKNIMKTLTTTIVNVENNHFEHVDVIACDL